jgi:hypothetical protein
MQGPMMGYVPPVTRRWAVTTLVLAIILLLMSIPSFFKWHDTVAMLGSKAPFDMMLQVVMALTTIAFIISSIATLKGLEWGREMMSMVSAVAIVETLLGVGLQWSLKNDPHWTNALAASMMKNSASTMSASDLPRIAGMVVMVTFIMSVVMGVVQIVYCAMLYRHMSAEPADPGIMSADPSAWPPSPTS